MAEAGVGAAAAGAKALATRASLVCDMPGHWGAGNTHGDRPRGVGSCAELAPAGVGGHGPQGKGDRWQCVCGEWVGAPSRSAHLPSQGPTDRSPAALGQRRGHCQAGAEMAATPAEEGAPELICH